MKKNKGITLIALVITIIVMLILVGVTLRITFDENGIIEKTKLAKERQENEATIEMLQTFALGSITRAGTINLSELNNKETNGYTITYTGGDDYATATNGEKTFYIDKIGNVTTTIIPHPVEQNAWQVRGLKSTNVQYDKIYSGKITYKAGIKPEQNYVNEDITVEFKSNGDFNAIFGSAEDSMEIPATLINNYTLNDQSEPFALDENSFSFIDMETGKYLTFYINGTSIEIYLAPAEQGSSLKIEQRKQTLIGSCNMTN